MCFFPFLLFVRLFCGNGNWVCLFFICSKQSEQNTRSMIITRYRIFHMKYSACRAYMARHYGCVHNAFPPLTLTDWLWYIWNSLVLSHFTTVHKWTTVTCKMILKTPPRPQSPIRRAFGIFSVVLHCPLCTFAYWWISTQIGTHFNIDVLA